MGEEELRFDPNGVPLKELRDAGIIHGTVEGPNRRYCLNPDAFGHLRVLFTVLEQRGRRTP